MLPLKDDTRSPSRFPVVTLSLIVVNLLAFVLELTQGESFVLRWALVPTQVFTGSHWITLFTSMFMHGGWLHLIGNMVFFWVFAPAIEEAMGSGRFLSFYLLGGLVAALAQIVVAPTSTVPTLGASGAIAAVMGAFVITYPRDKIRTVLFLGIFATVTRVSAIVLIGLWFLTQVISAAGVLATTQIQQSGVAYMAHVGGFLFGLIVARFFEDPERLAEQDTPALDS